MSVDVSPTIDAQKNLLAQIVTEQSAILTALSALRTGNEPDYSSISKSEDAGSSSWNFETLTARYEALGRQAILCLEQIDKLQMAAPFTLHQHVRPGGGFI